MRRLKKHGLIKWAALPVAAVFLSGCFGAKTVSYHELRNASSAHYGDISPDVTYYCGTEKGYDYFYIEYGEESWNEGRKYRILSANSPIGKRFERTTDRDKWVKVTLQDG